MLTGGFRRVNGQIQYGSARPLTLQPTVVVRRRTMSDPTRFPGLTNATRPVALLFGASLLLGALLTAAPRQVPDVAIAVVLGGAWLSLVLAMTLPRSTERAGQELVRRLALFRHEMNALGDTPSRGSLERMIARAGELGLQEHEVAEEVAHLRACLEAATFKDTLTSGELPLADAPDPLPPGDRCHFVSPVRFGRRRSDQFGHLMLTSGWLKFRGSLDITVTWHDIASVARDGRDIVVRLQDSRRILRFSCHSLSEAARGGVLAEHLTQVAHAETARGHEPHHATL
jgi:hypothetical protein